MRKAALLAAVMLAATFTTATSHAAAKKDPAMQARMETDSLLRDAMNPYGATSKPEKKHAMRHKKGKKKKA